MDGKWKRLDLVSPVIPRAFEKVLLTFPSLSVNERLFILPSQACKQKGVIDRDGYYITHLRARGHEKEATNEERPWFKEDPLSTTLTWVTR